MSPAAYDQVRRLSAVGMGLFRDTLLLQQAAKGELDAAAALSIAGSHASDRVGRRRQ